MLNPYARRGFGFDKKETKAADDEDALYQGFGDLAGQVDRIASTVAAGNNNGGANGGGMGAPTAGGNVRPPSGFIQPVAADAGPRPMTSAKGAGYTSAGKRPGKSVFDPLQQAEKSGPAPALIQKNANSAEHQARDMEKGVNRLIEESAAASVSGDLAGALEKAKEATRKERLLCKHRDKNGLSEQINFDLTYATCFNLAHQYHCNGHLTEALATYGIVVKNKQYPQAGRLRVNMGNIYYQQKKYTAAIKMYRMAMDQIGNTSRDMRFKIMRNIGNSFVRLGQFQDAIQSFEAIMNPEASPDAQTGFNLIVCYYALGDREKMKKGFQNLLSVQEYADDDEDEDDEMKEVKEELGLRQDELKKDKFDRKKVTSRYVHQAAKLIAPVIDKDMPSGFDWVVEALKAPRRQPGNDSEAAVGAAGARQGFPTIAMEMEISKGIAFLKRKNIKEAIDVFKSFERKDAGLVVQAATNLSFLYFLEGDYKNAEKYAELAVKSDRYNAKALVNKANFLFVKGDLEGSKELYLEAIGVEADCVEAIYNLGLTNKRLSNLEDALQAFKKLHRIIPKDPQVIFQIANLFDLLGDFTQAAEWFKILHGCVLTDPKVLARLGTLYNKEEDETQAFHNFSDSYNCYPVHMEVISWLGVWFVKGELYEDAIQFFERAAEIEPNEVKWQLMVASCYRRMGSYTQALTLYKKIHKQYPENLECLRYLCNICKDVNDSSYEEYSKLLKKAERAAATKDSRYMRDDMKEQMSAAKTGAMDTPSTSPTPHATHKPLSPLSRTPKKDLNDSFTASISPTAAGMAVNQGRKGEEDGWNDDDELLLPGT